jgi:hypothetical protein
LIIEIDLHSNRADGFYKMGLAGQQQSALARTEKLHFIWPYEIEFQLARMNAHNAPHTRLGAVLAAKRRREAYFVEDRR